MALEQESLGVGAASTRTLESLGVGAASTRTLDLEAGTLAKVQQEIPLGRKEQAGRWRWSFLFEERDTNMCCWLRSRNTPRHTAQGLL